MKKNKLHPVAHTATLDPEGSHPATVDPEGSAEVAEASPAVGQGRGIMSHGRERGRGRAEGESLN